MGREGREEEERAGRSGPRGSTQEALLAAPEEGLRHSPGSWKPVALRGQGGAQAGPLPGAAWRGPPFFQEFFPQSPRVGPPRD